MIKKKIKTWGYIHSFSLFSLGYKFIVSNLFISVKETLLKLFLSICKTDVFIKPLFFLMCSSHFIQYTSFTLALFSMLKCFLDNSYTDSDLESN